MDFLAQIPLHLEQGHRMDRPSVDCVALGALSVSICLCNVETHCSCKQTNPFMCRFGKRRVLLEAFTVTQVVSVQFNISFVYALGIGNRNMEQVIYLLYILNIFVIPETVCH